VALVTDWLKLFQEAAAEIRREAQPLFGSAKAKERQGRGAGGDVTRFVDALAESIVLRTLIDNNIPCILVSEESGTQQVHGGGDDYVVLDAIDGTTNALRRVPFSATSIAHASGPMLEDVDVGFIMELNSGATYKAQKGRGAYEEERPPTPSTIPSLEEAIVSVELTYRRDFHGLIQRLIPIMARTSKLRQLGSTALETAYVASGVLDAFIDLRGLTRAVDLAAATLIVREAGAFIVGPDGEDLDMELRADERTSFVAAGNRRLLEEIMSLIT
jgi:myo-inositol-1(or 4)-monophosphatase